MTNKIETATMKPTVPVRLAKYLIAQKLSDLTKNNAKLHNAAIDLVKKTYSELSVADVIRVGFNKTYFSELKPYGTLYMNNAGMKKVAKTNIANNPNFTREEATVLSQALLFFGRFNLVYQQLDKVVPLANKISPKFGVQVSDIVDKVDLGKSTARNPSNSVDNLYASLKELVKEATGKVGVKITQDRINALKTGTQKQATLVSNYNAIKRKITASYDKDLASYIARQDKPPYVHEAYLHMEDLGYETHKLIATPKKIPLKVNIAAGKLIYMTEDGRTIDGGIPPDAVKITFMKTYDPATGKGAYLSYTTPNAAGITRKYTEEHKKVAGVEKFDKADLVAENITKYVTKWSRDLNSKDDTIAMAATVCMLIYKTGMRVGTKVNSRSISGDKAYGALTLLVKQVTLSPTKITLKYIAKKQVPQTNIIPVKDKYDKIILRNLKEFVTGKTGTDLVFSYENARGTVKRLTPQQLTTYLKSMGYTAGIHKIRHVRGTNLAIALLNSKPWRPSKEDKTLNKRQASAEEYIKAKILKPVADLLGHKSKDGKPQWQTSISNYLNPAPFVKWFKDNGLRLPKWLPKTAN